VVGGVGDDIFSMEAGRDHPNGGAGRLALHVITWTGARKADTTFEGRPGNDTKCSVPYSIVDGVIVLSGPGDGTIRYEGKVLRFSGVERIVFG
jgi:hypothetical protein